MSEYEDQPLAEHTTRDPWPDGFAVPAELEKLKVQAEKAG